MRFLLALILVCAVLPSQAQDSPPESADPLTVLLTHYAAPVDERAAQAPAPPTAPPGSGAKLAEAQADLSLIAEAFETFRDPAQTQRALASVPGGLDPDLRKFFKDRDTTLQAVDRTLAVFDFTWALRFPDPPCPARNLRAALIFSGDGLLEDLKADRPSPWLERLLGPQPAGRTAEQSLDLAAAVLPLTPLQYERERARARLLTEALNSERAQGAARAKLYCERATAYARMALAHQPASAPVAAGRGTNGEAAAASASVLLVAFKDGDHYRALGAGVLARSGGAAGFLTDASVVTDPETHALRPGLAAFSRPADGSSKLEGPYALSVDTVPEFGAVLGRLDGARDLPALEVSDSTAAMSELLQALGHLNGFGAWTRTQGLVTRSEGDWFQSDAILDGEMAGGPLLDEQGRLVGLIARAPSGVAGVHAYRLRELLQGGTPSIIAPGKALAGAPGTGSSAILSPAVAFPLQGFVAPGAGAIETGLPMNLGGVNWNAPELHVAGPHYYPHTTPSYSRPASSSGSGESWGFGGGTYASPSFNGPMARDSVMGFLILSITEPTRKIFQGLGMLMFSPGTAFKNLQKNAKHHRAAPPAPTIVRVEPVKPPPPPPPPPKVPLKPSGLSLSLSKEEAKVGDPVILIAQVSFTGEEGTKSGWVVSFSVPSDRVRCPGNCSVKSDSKGDAEVQVTIIGRSGDIRQKVSAHAAAAMDDLDRESAAVRDEESPETAPSPPPGEASAMNAWADVVDITAETAGLQSPTRNLSVMLTDCPEGTVAATPYGQGAIAFPAQHGAQDSYLAMKEYTRCDDIEAQVRRDCPDRDTSCRGAELKTLGYDFSKCPHRVHAPSSGSGGGQAAQFGGMRPFHYAHCIPKADVPNYGKAYSDGGGERGWFSRETDKTADGNGTENSSSIRPGSISDLENGATLEKNNKSKILRKVGGFYRAKKDFDQFSNGLPVETYENGVRSVALPDGTTASLRETSSAGRDGSRPTIQIDPPNGGKTIKIRYDP